jgi:hypothetical protein
MIEVNYAFCEVDVVVMEHCMIFICTWHASSPIQVRGRHSAKLFGEPGTEDTIKWFRLAVGRHNKACHALPARCRDPLPG